MCRHQHQDSHLIQQLSLSPAIRKLRRVPADCPSFPSAIRFCIYKNFNYCRNLMYYLAFAKSTEFLLDNSYITFACICLVTDLRRYRKKITGLLTWSSTPNERRTSETTCWEIKNFRWEAARGRSYHVCHYTREYLRSNRLFVQLLAIFIVLFSFMR